MSNLTEKIKEFAYGTFVPGSSFMKSEKDIDATFLSSICGIADVTLSFVAYSSPLVTAVALSLPVNRQIETSKLLAVGLETGACFLLKYGFYSYAKKKVNLNHANGGN
ncbi:MAG TPA: hypothetical protein VJB94_01290 [Candidatus Nanoarchaeia archaeon]|nr:hypothetical protein [Candidatus Nanoarchaeia archaeon]